MHVGRIVLARMRTKSYEDPIVATPSVTIWTLASGVRYKSQTFFLFRNNCEPFKETDNA